MTSGTGITINAASADRIILRILVLIGGGGTTETNSSVVYLSQNLVAYNSTYGATAGGPNGSAMYSFNNNRFAQNGTHGGPFPTVAFQ